MTIEIEESIELLCRGSEPSKDPHLLIFDTNDAVRSACAEIAQSLGFSVESTGDRAKLFERLRVHRADVVLVDLPSTGAEGRGLVSEIKLLYPAMSAIAMTSSEKLNTAIDAMRCGACDYLAKPFSVNELSTVLGRAATSHRTAAKADRIDNEVQLSPGLGSMIGRSTEMEKIYRILSKVAQTSHPVLILGESGTGKEVVARTIHRYGPNSRKPFLPVDCGSLVPSLIETELFGHVKGAFTGANRSRDGLLASAEGGTVFLDEIGELPLDLQAKLLRALQEREVRPVGATHRVPIKARIIAATNRDLVAMVATGGFRKDLFYRLNVVNLRMPALRDRRGDIPLLAAHFLDRISRERGAQYALSDQALTTMMRYDWPGNIRELENSVERACTLSSGLTLHLGDLPTQLQNCGLAQVATARAPDNTEDKRNRDKLVKTLTEIEKDAIENAILATDGDKVLAAKLLGIGKTTLYRKVREYGI